MMPKSGMHNAATPNTKTNLTKAGRISMPNRERKVTQAETTSQQRRQTIHQY